MPTLQEFVQTLKTDGAGRVAINVNVAKVAPLIETNAQAIAALKIGHEYLWKAYQQLSGYNLSDIASGVYRANLSLITSTIAFIEKLRAKIPQDSAPASAYTRNATALTLLQAIDCLKITDQLVRASNDFSYAEAFFDALAQVIAFILNRVVKPTLEAAASSLWVPLAIAAGGVLLISSLKK